MALSHQSGRVNTKELMRFHPFLNTLSYTTVVQLLKIANLAKLMVDTTLYNEGQRMTSVYFVLSGILVLHNTDKGAVGLVTYDSTLGEECWHGKTEALEYAVAYQQCYLLEIDCQKLRELSKLIAKTDFIKIQRHVEANHRKKQVWRQ